MSLWCPLSVAAAASVTRNGYATCVSKFTNPKPMSTICSEALRDWRDNIVFRGAWENIISGETEFLWGRIKLNSVGNNTVLVMRLLFRAGSGSILEKLRNVIFVHKS